MYDPGIGPIEVLGPAPDATPRASCRWRSSLLDATSPPTSPTSDPYALAVSSVRKGGWVPGGVGHGDHAHGADANAPKGGSSGEGGRNSSAAHSEPAPSALSASSGVTDRSTAPAPPASPPSDRSARSSPSSTTVPCAPLSTGI